MIELTDADLAEIERSMPKDRERDIYKSIYIAGMKAMAERCAVACEGLIANSRDDPVANAHDGGLIRAARTCRALAKE